MIKKLKSCSNKPQSVVVVTGGFDPVTPAHISLFQEAAKLGDMLVVYANSDEWLRRKKRKAFMPGEDRCNILSAIGCVDEVVLMESDDDTDDTSVAAIKDALTRHKDSKIIFANGGDRTKSTTPEQKHFLGVDKVEFVFGVGGAEKTHASSVYLKNWTQDLTTRRWGHYNVLYYTPTCKVKELVLSPGRFISLQKHYHRKEYWVIVSGTAEVVLNDTTSIKMPGDMVRVDIEEKHKITNIGQDELKIIEVQLGSYLEEDDIVRYEKIDEESEK